MGYRIDRLQDNDLELVRLTDEHTGTEALILPEFGSLLHGFSIPLNGKSVNVIDHYGSRQEASSGIDKTFKSARLSPFVCRIARGQYRFQGKAFDLKHRFSDGSAIHGLLYDKAFTIKEEQETQEMATVAAEFTYRRMDPGYPFVYACEIRYTLMPGSILRIVSTITNQDEMVIPISDGWHPYFTLGGQVDDWIMHFDSTSMVAFDEELIPTGSLIPSDHFTEPRRIGSLFLDNCFVLNFSSGLPACELFNPENKLKLAFFPERSYPYLQVYTPDHRSSIAIENLSSAPDSFNNQMGLILLGPGDSQRFAVQYQLSVV
jgi:aldose 1-epimerase